MHEPIKTVAEAARLAKDDDLVLIAPGNYVGDVAVWTQSPLRQMRLACSQGLSKPPQGR